MSYVDPSNRLASKHPILSGSLEDMVLATLSLLDESSVPVTLLLSVLDANTLSGVLSGLRSKSLLLSSRAKYVPFGALNIDASFATCCLCPSCPQQRLLCTICTIPSTPSSSQPSVACCHPSRNYDDLPTRPSSFCRSRGTGRRILHVPPYHWSLLTRLGIYRDFPGMVQ
jgi:hypothetical protein